MKLSDIKNAVTKLIEEWSSNDYTDDDDLKNKLNFLIDSAQFELATTVAPIIKITDGHVIDNDIANCMFSLPDDCFRVKNIIATAEFTLKKDGEDVTETRTIPINYRILPGNKIKVDDTLCKVYVEYLAYPGEITDSTSDNSSLDIDPAAQRLLIWAVAGDLLKSDTSVNYAAYEQRYKEKRDTFIPRSASSPVVVENIFGGLWKTDI